MTSQYNVILILASNFCELASGECFCVFLESCCQHMNFTIRTDQVTQFCWIIHLH